MRSKLPARREGRRFDPAKKCLKIEEFAQPSTARAAAGRCPAARTGGRFDRRPSIASMSVVPTPRSLLSTARNSPQDDRDQTSMHRTGEADMRTGALIGLTVVAGLLLGVSAQAQQPSSSEPGRGAPPPDYGQPIEIDQAKMVAEAAVAEAKKNNWHMAVTVVGPQGELIYFEKMDGTQSSSGTLV
jgi:hypothetical protein